MDHCPRYISQAGRIVPDPLTREEREAMRRRRYADMRTKPMQYLIGVGWRYVEVTREERDRIYALRRAQWEATLHTLPKELPAAMRVPVYL